MNNERINTLFEALKNEPSSVSSNEVLGWLDRGATDLRLKRNSGWLKYFLLFTSSILILSMWLFFNSRSSQHKDKISIPLNEHSLQKPENKDDIFENTNQKLDTTIKNLMIANNTPIILIDSINNIDENLELFPSPIEMIIPEVYSEFNVDTLLKTKPVIETIQTEVRNLLFVLDSIQSYKYTTRYKMDEPDCYLQIHMNYVVISYRYRNKNYYASGPIHREEIQEIDGKIFRVFALQIDNEGPTSNFGSRVFFGYRERENETNNIELIFFNQPWAPVNEIIGHTASPLERKKLIERSKSQE